MGSFHNWITNLATRVTGILGIANGGTGQDTAQEAINALTAVSAATNEHVLTKDTATGNATYKAIPAQSSPSFFSLPFDVGATLAGFATRYWLNGAVTNADEARAGLIVPKNGTVSMLGILIVKTAQPATGTLVVTLVKNGVESALSVIVPANSAANYFGFDAVNSLAVSAGDRLSLKLVNNASTTSAELGSCTIKLT